jgi:hypothetical protein
MSGHVYVSYRYQFYLYIYLCAIFTYKMYLPYIRTDLISISYKQIFFLISSILYMYCTSCDNIPFWKWLQSNRSFATSIYCKDFGNGKLLNLQLSNFKDDSNFNDDCPGEYLCTLSFESIIKCIAYTLKISTRFPMKNSLKMPKKKSEAIIRRTDNTMAKW